jgi:hypothetical protein
MTHEVPKRHIESGRVTVPPKALDARSKRRPRAISSEERAWAWMSLFPVVFVLGMIFLYWASVVGLLLALGIVAGVVLVLATATRIRRR